MSEWVIAILDNYRQMVGRSAVRQPIAAAFVARLRDGGTPLAMVLTVEHGTGSYAVAGFAAGAFGLAAALSRPVHGWLLDRLGQRVLLLTAGVLIERTGTSGTFLFTAGVALAGAVVLWARPAPPGS
ncbi:hypothetical protein AB0M35_08705 [Micromonospora sp. NPDC051196]|uniref:hypothetical protein n=1 Tax=Micromonospora sp. NPDC051196 TaxID=3155281 RepID=UPI00342B8827